MSTATVGQLVREALDAARLSQRATSDLTGIPQSAISRITNGERKAKTTELMLIAKATGRTYAELTGGGTREEQVQWAARSTAGSSMEGMKKSVLHFIDLDQYLSDQAI